MIYNFVHSSSNGKLLAEYDQTGACMKDYIYMGSTNYPSILTDLVCLSLVDNKLLAEFQPSGSKYYYYTSDQINSTRIITDSTGAVVYSALFDPYGGMQKQWVNTYDPSLKFSGKERESGSELDYFGARYYGHKSYRFLSVDPIINKDEALANPQLWNLYAYCVNNPITYLDPDGMKLIKVDLPLAKGVTLNNYSPYLDDTISPLVQKFIDSAKKAGVEITFSNAFRPEGVQEKLQDDDLAVTPAAAGTSLHEAGFAFDINWGKIPEDKKSEIVKLAKEQGFSWGGDFNKKDNPHFYKEVPDGTSKRSGNIQSARDEYKKLISGDKK
jgi:RHS repeat-associated protein